MSTFNIRFFGRPWVVIIAIKFYEIEKVGVLYLALFGGYWLTRKAKPSALCLTRTASRTSGSNDVGSWDIITAPNWVPPRDMSTEYGSAESWTHVVKIDEKRHIILKNDIYINRSDPKVYQSSLKRSHKWFIIKDSTFRSYIFLLVVYQDICSV